MENVSKNIDPAIAALRVVRHRAPMILLCFVLTAVAAFAISKHQHKQYTALAQILFRNAQQDQQAAGLPVLLQANQQPQTDTNLRLATLPAISAATAAEVGHGLTAGKVRASVSVDQISDTQLVAVSVTSASPALSATIANAYGRQVIAARQQADQDYYANALQAVNQQFRSLRAGRQPATVQGASLQDRAASLQILSRLQSSSAQLAQPASVPTAPSSPKVARNTLLGAVLGLLLGLGFAFALERFDRRLREPSDLEDVYELPLIGVVPEMSALGSDRPGAQPASRVMSSGDAEVFGLLRAHIRFADVDRELRVVLIASAASGDGKTTIAYNLALAAARVGSRVLLVDLDLRRPSVAQELKLENSPGVVEVLVGSVPLEEAIQTVEPGDHVPSGTALHVLVAGGVLPANAAQVIESHAMQVLLEHAKATYDLVVVDTSPLSIVSDAFPLLRLVDGVVIVGRLGRNRRDVAARLRATLVNANAPLIGVVANGFRQRGKSSYGYGYGYGYTAGEGTADPALAAASNGVNRERANGASPSPGAPEETDKSATSVKE